jgi:hypothetical protein
LLLPSPTINDFWVGGGLEELGLPPLKSDDVYTPFTGNWAPSGGSTASDHLDGSATLLPNGNVLIAGGSDGTGDGQIGLDLYEGGGTYATSNSKLPYPVTQQAAALVTDSVHQTQKVLLAGGQNGDYSYFYNSALLYQEGTNPGVNDSVGTSHGTLSVGRAGATSVALPGARILITGGQSAGGPVNAVDIYDGNAADNASSTLYPASLYSLSGVSYDFFAQATASTNAVLPEPLVYHTATLLNDGRVLIAGGETTGSVVQSVLYIWDPAANSGAGGFYPLGTALPGGIPIAHPVAATLLTARAKHNAVLLENGTVLLFGGFGSGNSALSSAEVVDPNWVWSAAIPKASTPAASLNTARALASATLLQNGTAVVAGGYGAASLGTSETFTALESYSFPTPTGFIIPLNDGSLVPTGYTAGASYATLTFNPDAPFIFLGNDYFGVEITNYSWTINSAGTAVSGQGTPVFNFGTNVTGTFPISVQLTDQWGITSTCSINIDVTGAGWTWSGNTCP